MTTDSLLDILPPRLASACHGLSPSVKARYEEVRLRQGRPLSVAWSGREQFVDAHGALVDSRAEALIVERAELEALVEHLTEHSLYAWQEELRSGYLTLRGGSRVGLAGEVHVDGGRIVRLQHVSQVSIRRSRAVPGCAASLVRRLVDRSGSIYSTLILSPPGCGKTTLLRELCRLVSDGSAEVGLDPHTVGLVDERCEIAAAFGGEPQHDVGGRTDVLSRAPKPEGVRMLLRSMAPGVVVTDEIGSEADATALLECTRAGVRVLASVHAGSVEDLQARPSLRTLIREGAFSHSVILSRRRGPGTIESVAVLNGRAKPIR